MNTNCSQVREDLVQELHVAVRAAVRSGDKTAVNALAAGMTPDEINRGFWRAAGADGGEYARIEHLQLYRALGGDVNYRPVDRQSTVAEELMTAAFGDSGERRAFIKGCRREMKTFCSQAREDLVQELHVAVRSGDKTAVNAIAATMTPEEINATFWGAATGHGSEYARGEHLQLYRELGGDVNWAHPKYGSTVAEELMTSAFGDREQRTGFIYRCREK